MPTCTPARSASPASSFSGWKPAAAGAGASAVSGVAPLQCSASWPARQGKAAAVAAIWSSGTVSQTQSARRTVSATAVAPSPRRQMTTSSPAARKAGTSAFARRP